MRYFKSQARLTFDSATRVYIQDIRNAYRSRLSTAFMNHIYSSTLCLTSAQIENYIEAVFSGWFFKINSLTIKTDKVPVRIKAFLLCRLNLNHHFKKMFLNDDEKTLMITLGDLISQNKFDFLANGNTLQQISKSLVYDKKKYPSPDNFKSIFHRIGVNEIFNELNRLSRKNIELLLESFNDYRTMIAHQGRLPPGMNEKDVINKVKDAQEVIHYTDRFLYSFVRRECGHKYWPN